MKKKKFSLALLLMILASCGGGDTTTTTEPKVVPPEDDKVHLIILAGQSGARGKSLNSDLTDEQAAINDEVDIIAEGLQMPHLNNIPEHISNGTEIDELKPGYGDATSEFGPEIGMGQTMRSRYLKDGELRKSVIIKYTACGSTFTSDWFSSSAIEDETICPSLNLTQVRTNEKTEKQTGPLTNNLYEIIDRAIEQLTEEGFESVIDGAVFLHGEQDAKFDVNMSIYEKSLEYFIKDLRDYVGNNELPVVVTEAITNSAKYSNQLREIQKRVASNDEHTTFISARDLYPNTFEPWHFGAAGSIEIGNRIAAEIISHYDYRKVRSFEEKTINVPAGVNIELPAYLRATFENDMEGLVKVSYTSSYDNTKIGEQIVNYKATTVYGDYNGSLKVVVGNDPYVDGTLNEYSNVKKNTVEGVGDIYVVKGENGLYVGANINDNDLWTDGENWASADMGQRGENDDFRVYITNGEDVDNKIAVFLSAANLLRVYEPGTDLSKNAELPRHNMVYSKDIENYSYRVNTKGLVNVQNDPSSEGMTLEFFISYDDLGIENPDDIRLCFNYSNVTKDSGKKVATDHYFMKSNDSKLEESISNYFSISELI